jgi:hypothetical protein
MMQCHVKRDMVEQFTKNSPDDEIPKQVWFGYHLKHLLGWGFSCNRAICLVHNIIISFFFIYLCLTTCVLLMA